MSYLAYQLVVFKNRSRWYTVIFIFILLCPKDFMVTAYSYHDSFFGNMWNYKLLYHKDKWICTSYQVKNDIIVIPGKAKNPGEKLLDKLADRDFSVNYLLGFLEGEKFFNLLQLIRKDLGKLIEIVYEKVTDELMEVDCLVKLINFLWKICTFLELLVKAIKLDLLIEIFFITALIVHSASSIHGLEGWGVSTLSCELYKSSSDWISKN